MNRTFEWLVLEALWIILRYLTNMTKPEHIANDARQWKADVGRYFSRLESARDRKLLGD